MAIQWKSWSNFNPVDIWMKSQWKSIGNPVEIQYRFQWNINGNPLEIQLKFQWNTNRNPLEIQFKFNEMQMENLMKDQCYPIGNPVETSM